MIAAYGDADSTGSACPTLRPTLLFLVAWSLCLTAGTARAGWVLEYHHVDARTWPTITFLIAPHGHANAVMSPPDSLPRVTILESGRREAVPPDVAAPFADTSVPLDIVLVLDANRGMEPYFQDIRHALESFARSLASEVPRAVVRLVAFGADVTVYPAVSAPDLEARIAEVPLQDRPGVRFDDAMCQALAVLGQGEEPRRRLLLFVGEGPLELPADRSTGNGPPSSVGLFFRQAGKPAPHQSSPIATPSVGTERRGILPCPNGGTSLGVPAYIMAFSPTSWVARDRKAVERFFQDLAGPTGMVDRVDVPLDTVRVPDFATPLRVWTRAITGALLVSYRIRATPPATVRIRLNVDETPLPVAVDVRVSRGDGGGRLDRFKSWGQVALLVFFFAATVLQWLSVRKMAHIIMRKNRQEDKQATTAPRGDQAG